MFKSKDKCTKIMFLSYKLLNKDLLGAVTAF